MRVELKELLEKLGVARELSAYEAQPWLLYDEENGITCSAEVRMGPGAEDLEAEIQYLYDEEQEEEKITKGENGDDSDETVEIIKFTRKQILHMRALPKVQGQWTPVYLMVNGKNYVNEIYDWEGKGCEFFRACIEAIQMGELPNIEELMKKELKDDSKGSGKRGRIGRKSPNIKPGQLLGMKK